ncbi:unnamed protein product [Arabidopsis halleri]
MDLDASVRLRSGSKLRLTWLYIYAVRLYIIKSIFVFPL